MVTGLARISGHSVGIIANQPSRLPERSVPTDVRRRSDCSFCATRSTFRVVSFQDTPGFMVGTKVEHDRLLDSSMRFLQAWALCGAPKLTVVVRKAFGMAFFSMGGSQMGSDVLVAWPGAEIGFYGSCGRCKCRRTARESRRQQSLPVGRSHAHRQRHRSRADGPDISDALDRLFARATPARRPTVGDWPSS